ncbi:Putative protein of unknown function [Podospora comata]|uniref:Uncharacterized protein n=1 Tax=Podospora comata TaxID=48703 RepID=A0ABY6SDM2_PODCO|nr:Putative protein of unknown function [Podospora comata]
MSKQQEAAENAYFLISGWDISEGTIALDSIITDPMHPQLALFKPSSPVEATTIMKSHFINREDESNHHPIALFRLFVNLFGLGNDDLFHNNRKKPILCYSIRGLQTSSFMPSSDELKLKGISESERALQFLNASKNQASMFMVTGIKSIRGASVRTESNKGWGWVVELSVGLESGDGEGKATAFAFELTRLKLSDSGDLVAVGDGLKSIDKLQSRLDKEFGEAIFTVFSTTDEQTGESCQAIAPSPARVDLLTASSARINAPHLHN